MADYWVTKRRAGPPPVVEVRQASGRIASDRVLPAQRELAEFLALHAGPGVAVEQDVGGVHVAGLRFELALQAEDGLHVVVAAEV